MLLSSLNRMVLLTDPLIESSYNANVGLWSIHDMTREILNSLRNNERYFKEGADLMECDNCGYEGKFYLIREGVSGKIPDKWKCPQCREIQEMGF